jgi:hypothetical protein
VSEAKDQEECAVRPASLAADGHFSERHIFSFAPAKNPCGDFGEATSDELTMTDKLLENGNFLYIIPLMIISILKSQ